MSITTPEFPETNHYEELASPALAPIRNDTYRHFNFTESDSPELATEAQRIHAEGYHVAGFVKDDAITEDGRLQSSIDKSRGDNVEYFLAINPEDMDDCATMRIVSIPNGGTYKDLPGYKIVGDSIHPLGHHFLDGITNGSERIKEVSAMAPGKKGGPIAQFETIRNAIHAAMGRDEVWFFGMVTTTHVSLSRSLSPKNLQVLGEDVLVEGDNVVDGVKLRPAILQPDKFIDNLADAFLMAARPTEQKRYSKNLLFFADGLDEATLSDRARMALSIIKTPPTPITQSA